MYLMSDKRHSLQLSGSVYQRVMFQRNAVVSFTVYHLVFVLFCIGLSVGVTIAVGLLLYYQVKIMLNLTILQLFQNESRFKPYHRVCLFRRQPAIFATCEWLSCRQLHTKGALLLIIIFVDAAIQCTSPPALLKSTATSFEKENPV